MYDNSMYGNSGGATIPPQVLEMLKKWLAQAQQGQGGMASPSSAAAQSPFSKPLPGDFSMGGNYGGQPMSSGAPSLGGAPSVLPGQSSFYGTSEAAKAGQASQYDAMIQKALKQLMAQKQGGGNEFYNPYMREPDISGFGDIIGGIIRMIASS